MIIRPVPFALSACLMIILGLLAACKPPTDPLPDTYQTNSALAAEVNGEPIYYSDVELEAIAQGLISPGDAFAPDHADFQSVLDQLIDQRLLAQEALRLKLDQGRDARRRLQAGRERLLGNILVESLVANEVTEEAIERMYAEQVKLQQLDDEVRVRLIRVGSQSEAEQVYSELTDGKPFSDAALQYTLDVATRLEGGDLGWISPVTLPDPFPAIIGDTRTGTFSEPFETSGGWHIVRVDERRTRPPKTRDEMRPEIITFLTFTQISDVLRDLRSSADIRQNRPLIRSDTAISGTGLEPEASGEKNEP